MHNPDGSVYARNCPVHFVVYEHKLLYCKCYFKIRALSLFTFELRHEATRNNAKDPQDLWSSLPLIGTLQIAML